jgi:hypothetical protein
MFDWLTDPSPTLYVILVIAALVGAGLWVRYQNKKTRVAAVVLVAALVLVFVVDLLVESPREQCVRKVAAIVDAVNARRPDDLLLHVSDSFDYKGMKKTRLGTASAWEQLRVHNVRVATWDFTREDVQAPDANTRIVGFMAKGEAAGRPLPFYIRAKFVRDADGQWRVQGFTAYDPIQKTNAPEVVIPGLP